MAKLKNWSRYEVDIGWQETDKEEVLANSTIKTFMDTKVDKETGKGLSSNDFDNNYKNALDNLSNDYVKKTNIAQTIIDLGLYPHGIEYGDWEPTNEFTIDNEYDIIVRVKNFNVNYNGVLDPVPNHQIILNVDKGYFTEVNGSSITNQSNSVSPNTNSYGNVHVKYKATEWGLVTFTCWETDMAPPSQALVSGWKEVATISPSYQNQNIIGTVHIYSDGKYGRVKYTVSVDSVTANSSPFNKTLCTIPTEWRPLVSYVSCPALINSTYEHSCYGKIYSGKLYLESYPGATSNRPNVDIDLFYPLANPLW